MKKSLILLLVLKLISLDLCAHERPKIGLVLSGGGARGGAHIGVIEVLEQYNVPIDLIVGTSMGAVIGGLYASGMPIEQIKCKFTALDWEEIFKYDVMRQYLYYQRKIDNDLFLIKNFIGFEDGKIRLSFGFTNGQNLYDVFKESLLPIEPIGEFKNLPIPFRAIATDLLSGQIVNLTQGDLALAMLASMAVPGIVSPVKMDGFYLVDGGVSDNLPIKIAKEMGADIIIAVNVSTPLLNANQIMDLTSVLSQITNILTDRNIKENKKFLTAQDIYIAPQLDNIDTMDFKQFAKAIFSGKQAALDKNTQLQALSDPSLVRMTWLPAPLIQLDRVKIQDTDKIEPKVFQEMLAIHRNILPAQKIVEDVKYLYGLNVFDRIFYGIENEEADTLVVIPKIPDTQMYFQESILMRSDFEDTFRYSFVVGLINPKANSLLGEWRLIGRIGSNFGLSADFYQPLEPSLSWYVKPYIGFERAPYGFYFDQEHIANYISNASFIGLEGGRNFHNWGRIKAFWHFLYDNLTLSVGSPFLFNTHVREGKLGVQFEWDTLDNSYFPHHGTKGRAVYSANLENFGGKNDFTQFASHAYLANSLGKHSLLVGGRYNTTLSGAPTIISKFYMGGLFQLTGFYDNEIFSNNNALLEALYYYEVAKFHFIPTRPFPVYLGASLEGARVWGKSNLLEHSHEMTSASMFIGSDTIIGPIYLAFGMTNNGHKAVHLMIGPLLK